MRATRKLHGKGFCSTVLSIWLGFQCFHGAQSQTPDNFNPGANGIVSALAVQPDGKIVVGGLFTQIGGLSRTRLARLQPDGVVDTTFAPAANNTVYSLAIQPDGKVLVGGDFTSLAGGSKLKIGRLNTNGTLDTGFTMTVIPPPDFTYDIRVQAILIQPDGKIIVGGRNTITRFSGPAVTSGFNLRLNTNGTTDNTFITTGGVGGPLSTMAQQPDGKLLLGGLFTSLRNVARNRMGRLNADGSLDLAFDPNVNGGVFAVAIQADEKILIGGNFTMVAGQPRTNLARLHPDGSLDDTYAPAVAGGATPAVYSLAVQTDGKVLVGGLFTTVAGQARMNLARLNPEGTLDPTFTATANNHVYGLALQADGKVLAGGQFFQLGGQQRSYVGRLNNTDPAIQALSDDGATITWLRGGTSPEVWRTTFDVSTNLTNWTYLGEGLRIPGGWQLTGLALPGEGRIRARGFARGGGFNGSSWFAETVGGPCAFQSQPSSRTNNAGTIASFTTAVSGSPPISYQWWKDGSPLTDGGFISGAQTATLNLAGVLGADTGAYSVIAGNSFGSVTSVLAMLKVIDPITTTTFYTNYADAGDTVTVTITAAGTPPLNYQWRKDGTNLPGAMATSLTLSNVQRADIGTYSVTVTNVFGATTSNRMVLDVNLALLDQGFPVFDGAIYGVAEQPDGKLLVGGNFSTVDGQPRPCLARFNSDGTLDTTFDPGTNFGINSWIYALSMQADGKVVAGGGFSLTQNSQTRFNLVRVSRDGVLDPSFNPDPSNVVLTLAEQDDGKIVAGGSFSTLNGQPRSYLGRLNSDGTLDTNFHPSVDYQVRSVLIQPDGKILVAGGYTYLAGQWRQGIGRLNSDGTADASFQSPGTDFYYPGANQPVNCLALQADGKILLGGDFTILGGPTRKYIGRLHSNGILDTSFNPAADYGGNGSVYSLAVQADGKILVGGKFTSIGGKQRSYLARLLPNGQADHTFNAAIAHNFVPIVSAGALSDGATLVSGSYTRLGGEQRTNLARLNPTDPTTQEITFDGATLTWWRSGTGPELPQVWFETSSNAVDWVSLGTGVRISDGWELSGASESMKTFLRARGVARGGYYSGSSWPVISTLTLNPKILSDDGGLGLHTNQFGFNVAGRKDQVVVIEASTNLTHWLPIQTNLVGSIGMFQFLDSTSGLFQRRFYRARLSFDPLPP
jgi:uncharacterized delta-60 repeat protein